MAKNPTIRYLVFYHQRLEAGIQRYSVGIDTPRFRATSRGGTPLRSSCRADCTLLGVMRRFRPTGRPRWRAAAEDSARQIEAIDYPETATYVRKVLSYWAEYAALYG